MQTLLVILIVAVAAIYLFRRFYRSFTGSGKSTCGCGCDGCTPQQSSACDSSGRANH